MDVDQLPEIVVNPHDTPTDITVRPVVGGSPEALMTLERFREEYPLLKTTFMVASELLEATSPSGSEDLGIGPTFDELLEVADRYLNTRVRAIQTSVKRDVGIYFWRQRVLNVLETAIRNAKSSGAQAVPILATPDFLDTEYIRRFQWTGITAEGRKCHLNRVPCHTTLEADFATFLDRAKDVVRYFKNERFGFSVTYYENNRPRQYFPDFIVVQRSPEGEVFWLAETKGEIRANTALKTEAAKIWCQKMSDTVYGTWKYVFAQQREFERAMAQEIGRLDALVSALTTSGRHP